MSDKVEISIQRPSAWNGAVRKIHVLPPNGSRVTLRSGESCQVEVDLGEIEVVASSGPSRAVWRGSVDAQTVLEVGFRGVFEALLKMSEVYIAEASS